MNVKSHHILLVFLLLMQGFLAGCADTPKETAAYIPSEQNESDAGVINNTVVDVFDRPEIQSNRITQAIYNQEVKILERADIWSRIELPDGMEGWVRSKYISPAYLNPNEANYNPRIVVTAKSASVYSNYMGGITLKEVVMGTELFVLNKKNNAYEVFLPGGMSGWIRENVSILISQEAEIPVTSVDDFVATASKFKGTSYLIGGISCHGIDCSGLIYICSLINGVNMPRKMQEQFRTGREAARDDIRAGDLVFFSSKENSGDLAEAGIYMGDGVFIYADRKRGYVTEGSLDNEYFQKRLAGIRRIFD